MDSTLAHQQQPPPAPLTLASAIASLCIHTFNRLPRHGKPIIRSNGLAEWTILAGIVMATPKKNNATKDHNDDAQASEVATTAATTTATVAATSFLAKDYDLRCISLGSGSKCLPEAKMSPKGDLLNDCHAEVLARRGFNLWCLQELKACLDEHQSGMSPTISNNVFRYMGDQCDHDTGDSPSSCWPLFELVDPTATFHLYVSQAPCGDATTASLASMQSEESRNVFLSGHAKRKMSTMREGTETHMQEPLENIDNTERQKRMRVESPIDRSIMDSTMSSIDAPVSQSPCKETAPPWLELRQGRVDYESLGVLRTKPGRVDAERSVSMSCSDKIARWNVLGITSAITSGFLAPIYLFSIVSQEMFDSPALDRAVVGRVEQALAASESAATLPDSGVNKDPCLKQLAKDQLNRPRFWKAEVEFSYSKDRVVEQVSDKDASKVAASIGGISWVAENSPSITAAATLSALGPLKGEVLTNGFKAGHSAKKQIPPKAQSQLCNIHQFRACIAIWELIPKELYPKGLKKALQLSEGDNKDESIDLGARLRDQLAFCQLKAASAQYSKIREELLSGVFRKWMVNLQELQQFNTKGEVLPV